jgi:hypothetical protein
MGSPVRGQKPDAEEPEEREGVFSRAGVVARECTMVAVGSRGLRSMGRGRSFECWGRPGRCARCFEGKRASRLTAGRVLYEV